MSSRVRIALPLLALVVASGCYHAVISTGLQASSDVIVKPWAHSFVYGLVPPAVTETAQRCPNGVARVETRHSFLNGLVGVLTWSLYTPIEITVTCAAGGRAGAAARPDVTANSSSTDDAGIALGAAVDLAVSAGRPIYVRF
jgi:hypothetical protein